MVFGWRLGCFPSFWKCLLLWRWILPVKSPSPPSSSSSSLAEGLSTQKGGITTAQQDQQSTKTLSGSSGEAVLILSPTGAVC